jgi:hypothetical protein
MCLGRGQDAITEARTSDSHIGRLTDGANAAAACFEVPVLQTTPYLASSEKTTNALAVWAMLVFSRNVAKNDNRDGCMELAADNLEPTPAPALVSWQPRWPGAGRGCFFPRDP